MCGNRINTAMKYIVSEISLLLRASLIGRSDLLIKFITIDSRRIIQPELSLFFALKGNRHDGHDYVVSLYKRGVRAFVIDKYRSDYEKLSEASFIIVKNVIESLHIFSSYHRLKFDYPVIGITGSNGKTIVKEWLYQMLMPSKRVVRSPRSYNSQVGVPLSLSLLSTEDDIAIIEAGISKCREMAKLERIVKPSIGILTNIGLAHSENFESDLEKLDEKLLLFRDSEIIIFSDEDERIKNRVRSVYPESKLLSWSSCQESKITVSRTILGSSSFVVISYNNTEFSIEIPFADDASYQNCMNCVVCLLYLNYDSKYIEERVKALNPVAMRLEIKDGINNCILINDYYNSDMSSMSIAIDMMEMQSKSKKRTIIISDFIQTGYHPDRLYSDLANLLKLKKIDRIIGIGDNMLNFQHLFTQDKLFYRTTSDFIRDFSREMFSNEIILLRAARDFHFEEISPLLQNKIHRTVLEVDLNAIEYNLNYYRSLIKSDTAITVMVKAFSYGNGLVDISKLLEYNRVDYLAVAIADEGISLRKGGISTPIIVMNPEEYSFSTMIEYNLEPEIYSIRQLKLFGLALERVGESAYPIHIKLDTGMRRMGFVGKELDELIKYIKSNKLFYIRSVFSHLAGSDEKQFDGFTYNQIDLFEKWSSLILSLFDYKILRHILNSSGIERFPNAQYDMVRLGIGLYGLSGTTDKLRNVSTLKTTISQIKNISTSETIGYGRKGILNRDSVIAVIPIGYADGYNRKLGNGLGKVIVNNKFVPTVGNICMDMCMIDVTDINVKEGDEVIIFGNDYSAKELAKLLDTIPYEIITSISERVKRVYISE